MQQTVSRASYVRGGVQEERQAIGAGGRSDPWILLAVSLLLGLSLLMVFSTTAMLSEQNQHTSTAMVVTHLIHIIVGLLAMAICSRVPVRLIYVAAVPAMVLSALLLLMVLIPGLGSSAGGAQRWLSLGPLRMQPGELAKVSMIIFIASYMHRQQKKLGTFKSGIVVPLAILAVFASLLLAQPDFGSTAVMSAIVFCQLFLAVRFLHWISVVAFGAAMAGLLVVLSPYRMRRLISFLDPFDDPSGAGYQLIQSLIAVGSEGVAGAGLGAGKQKLFYLPAAHTDFIYAVIAEELGLIGGLFVLSIFLLILWRGLELANALSERLFLSALALGLTLLVVLPALLNMGVVLGLLPTKGLVLPLVAYGGTSMVVQLSIVGLLLSLSRCREH